MKRRLVILTLALTATVCTGYSQSLLSVDWQKVVCTDGYIDHTYAICNDANGNTYTLGSFESAANCLGDTVNESSGHYFLTKQNSNGDKLFAKNFGGTDNFSFGDIKICNNGDIILGLCFKTDFFLNGISIATSTEWNSIILKLDQDFQLKWFKAFPAKNATYINKLVLDRNENVYASILFIDSLSINNNIYSQPNGYGTALAKLNSVGNILWTHHYYSENILINQVLRIEASDNSCPSTILISGTVNGDSILVDGSLRATHQSKFNSQPYVATLNEYGDVLQTKFLDDGIRSIVDIDFYQNRVFFAGSYIDTVNWNESQISPLDYSSIYIGELSHQADLIGFADLNSNKTSYLTGFNITPQYGFVLSGFFVGSSNLQNSSITLTNQYNTGSFIASIDDTLSLSDCKYITGGHYNLRHLTIYDQKISGTAVFEQTCNFNEQSCFAWNDDISTFQSSDFTQLTSFNPHSFPSSRMSIPFSAQAYPNPFRQSFTMKFSEPIYSTSLSMIDLLGQVCKGIVVSQINDTEVTIDAAVLSTGLYIVQYMTCNNSKGTYKLFKVN